MRRTLTLLVALALSLAAAPRASAQAMVFSDPSFDADEQDCIRMTLGLDEDQNAMFDELLQGYNKEFMQLTADFATLQDQEGVSDPDDVQDALDMLTDISERAETIQNRFFDDLELVLTTKQALAIDACKDRLKRMSVTRSEMSDIYEDASLGHDPVTLALDLGLPDRLDPETRDNFERAMRTYDRALDNRVDDLQEAIVEMLEGVTEQMEDPMGSMARIEERLGAIFKTAGAYREDHQDKGLAIARTLPNDLRRRWERTFMQGLYPDAHAPSDAEVVMDRLLLLPDMSAEEFASIMAVQDAHDAKAGVIRADWCDEIDDNLRNREFSLMALAMGMNDSDETNAPYEERLAKLDEQSLTSLRRAAGRERVDALLENMRAEGTDAMETETAPEGGIEIEIRVGEDDNG